MHTLRFVSPDGSIILKRLQELRRRARLLVVFSFALRFFAFGLFLSLPLLLLKGLLPLKLPLLLVGGSALIGVLYGSLRPLSLLAAARFLDSRLQLDERLSTALECLERDRRGDLIEALLRDAAKAVLGIEAGKAFPFRLPRKGRLLLPPLALAFLLLLLPPFPFSQREGQGGATAAKPLLKAGEERKTERISRRQEAAKQLEEGVQAFKQGALSKREPWGELPTHFQDTKLSRERPDFEGFLKQADKRLKLLGQAEALPTAEGASSTPFRLARHHVKEKPEGKLQALTPTGPSKEVLGQLLKEIGKLDKEVGPSGRAPSQGQVPPQEFGQTRGSKEALKGALRRRQGGDRLSKGSRDIPQQRSASEKEGSAGKGQGVGKKGGRSPGQGSSPEKKGRPTPRQKMGELDLEIEGPKRNLDLSGQTRERGREAYETELSGPGAAVPTRLPYLDLFARYRRMMEEAITKEPLPFDYREQVKTYFMSLERLDKRRLR